MSVKTAIIQGIMSLLNRDFRNAHPSLFFRDKGEKNPETKNMVGITIISIIKLRIPDIEFVERSKTIQKYSPPPLLS
jgi:hypothetical protein